MIAPRLVLLGAPGAGKGTQAARLVASLGVPHIATGDMLRAAVAAKTEIGVKAKAIMDSGKLVSDDVVIGIAKDRLQEPDAREGFILDGFPRTQAQAEALDEMLAELSSPLTCCLAITVNVDEVAQRLLKRLKLEGRADDTDDTIRERMKVYQDQTAPLLDYYRNQGLVREIDGMGDVDEVTARIRETLES